jgi:putative ABC transport system permease protein
MEWKFLASYFLVLVALWYSHKESLGVEKTLLVNSAVAFLQLSFLGFALGFILRFDTWWQTGGVILAMSLYGAFVANRRVYLIGGYWRALVSIGATGIFILSTLVLSGIISAKANQLIPIVGMILGNSLNVYTQVVERLKAEAKNTRSTIEGMTALGATLKQAMHEASRAGVKAAMLPTINSLQTVGIIHIPGVTVGMLLAGASAFDAVSYQLVVMYMMVAIGVLCAAITARLCYRLAYESSTN